MQGVALGREIEVVAGRQAARDAGAENRAGRRAAMMPAGEESCIWAVPKAGDPGRPRPRRPSLLCAILGAGAQLRDGGQLGAGAGSAWSGHCVPARRWRARFAVAGTV